MLKGKKILIGVTGSIAAYKIPFLVRLLVKEGAEVKVILTPAARDFITPLTLSTLSGHPVYTDFFEKEDGTWHSHVDLGNWADVYLLAPLSATTMGKMANGIADNLLTATYLAAKCPVFYAPAMDLDMYKHPATSKNIKKLKDFGNFFIEPEEGELASGLYGAGRMQEPEKIIEILIAFFKKKKDFENQHVLISAGPTYESIDPVRFIGNFSSGRMGYALAEEFARRGAFVTLISGPVSIQSNHQNISVTNVVSSAEMHKACLNAFPESRIAIMSAAVADYTPVKTHKQKVKKHSEPEWEIRLEKTKDILKDMGNRKKTGQILVGFALETENELENALHKLENKNLDLIVLNSLMDKGAGFGGTTNKVTFIDKNKKTENFSLKSKTEVAADIANKVKLLLSS